MKLDKIVKEAEKGIKLTTEIVGAVSNATPEIKLAIVVIQGFLNGLLAKPDAIDLDKLEQGLKSLNRYDEYLKGN